MGQSVIIYYGVKKGDKLDEDASVLDGHSWIKLNGEIFNDGDKNAPETYHITYSYPDWILHKSEKKRDCHIWLASNSQWQG